MKVPSYRSTASVLCLALSTGSAACDRSPTEEKAVGYAVSDTAKSGGQRLDVRAPAGREGYDRIVENEFVNAGDTPLSTFSIDVDTASYSNVRRFLRKDQLPPQDAVRIEEMLNYFDYAYEAPAAEHPLAVHTEVSIAPWAPEHRLVHIGVQGKDIAASAIPARNLVFLLDVSGSMNSPDKLPLMKRAMRLLVEQLDESDRVSVVVYAGASGVVLPPTPGSDSETILGAMDRLSAGGSTNGGQGIELAYGIAREAFIDGGINRVVLATDGDFNVGVTGRGSLERLIEVQRKSGVSLSVLGFGSGNLQDSQMEALADKGNGNYGYIDSVAEARKLLVEQAGGTLVTIAQDVKIQVEFNPALVSSYRLLGYENRRLNAQDFNDDNKDAGELGAGHTVTALYEVVPAGAQVVGKGIGPLRYQSAREVTGDALDHELGLVKLRYQQPGGSPSTLMSTTVADEGLALAKTSDAFRFSAAVASFGMLLRNSKHAGSANFASVEALAKGATGEDDRGYRREFIDLVRRAAKAANRGPQHG